MSAIVPYGGYQVARASPYVLKYGMRAYKAGRTIARGYRRYRRFKKRARPFVAAGMRGYKRARPYISKYRNVRPRLISGTRQHSHAVQQPSTGVADSYLFGQLYLEAFQYPVAGNENEPNTRKNTLRSKIMGLKICRTFSIALQDAPGWQGLASKPGHDITIHWMLIQRKSDGTFPTSPNPSAFTPHFFRSFDENSSGDNNAANFVPYTATSTFDMKMNCAPVNPNREFNIIARKKFRLGLPINGTKTQPMHLQFDHYFKLNRIVEFNAAAASQPRHPLYEMIWVNPSSDTYMPTNPIEFVAVRSRKSHTMYFRNML